MMSSFWGSSKFSSACHLEFVVALTRRISRVIREYFALFLGKCVPDAHSFAVDVPSALRLIGWASSSPGETCRGGDKTWIIIVFTLGYYMFDRASYRLGRCRSRKTFFHSWSSQSHHWLTRTAPQRERGTASGCTAASWSLIRSSLSSVIPKIH